jgi:hypothetical protein
MATALDKLANDIVTAMRRRITWELQDRRDLKTEAQRHTLLSTVRRDGDPDLPRHRLDRVCARCVDLDIPDA